MYNIKQVAIINANLLHDNRKIERRNVMQLMAATIYIALGNMKYWLQDQ
jgi:hypothetical protein